MPRHTVTISVHELLAQIKKHQSRLPKLQRAERKLLKKLSVVQAEIAQLSGLTHASRPGRKGQPKGVAKTAVSSRRAYRRRAKNSVKLADAIVGVLSKDSTKSVPQIAAAVKAGGYVSTSKTFETIIYQTVAHDKRIKRAGRGQYQLKG